MSKTYEITQQIHTELARLAESTGIKVEIESDFSIVEFSNNLVKCYFGELIYYNDGTVSIDETTTRLGKHVLGKVICPVIQSNQIKQILIAFEDVLGESDVTDEFFDFLKVEEDEDDYSHLAIAKWSSEDLDRYFEDEEKDGCEHVYNRKDPNISIKLSLDSLEDNNWHRERQLFEKIYQKLLKSQSKQLCQKWLDGLNPLFETEPEKVLTELLEILESIK